ncbi:hypothetical protein [Desulfovibrio sp. DV]|uniref:hypothetical protein n=1 Tax=Desulfovibrio sp. DV TaxID=1844708 RepID=UPI0011150955|nr:hypothetical protein [Desulfovibrio sp. DV]
MDTSSGNTSGPGAERDVEKGLNNHEPQGDPRRTNSPQSQAIPSTGPSSSYEAEQIRSPDTPIPANPSGGGNGNECLENVGDRIKKLREAVNSGGTQANANLIAYLAILIYFFVAVTSTSHEDLLRGTAKAVPLLNIQLPLWWFFLLGHWR